MINVATIWSYAGISMREREAAWCDTNRVRFLRQRGWGYVAPLVLDGYRSFFGSNPWPYLANSLMASVVSTLLGLLLALP